MRNKEDFSCPALEPRYVDAFGFKRIHDPEELIDKLKKLPNGIQIHDDIIKVIADPDPDSYTHPPICYLLSSLVAKPYYPSDYHKLMSRYLMISQMDTETGGGLINDILEEKRFLVSAIFDILDDQETSYPASRI